MREHKNICLFDTWNSYGNNGQEHALWTPHWKPDQEWINEYNDNHDDPWGGDVDNNIEFDFWAEDFWSDIKTFDERCVSTYRSAKGKIAGVLITGKLGLWNGSPNIYPVFCHTLKEALQKCWGSCNDFRVDIKNGEITCYGYHHDGTNIFTIYGVGTSGMTSKQEDELYDAGNGQPLWAETYDKLFAKTKRHIRKINLLKELGFIEKRLTATA